MFDMTTEEWNKFCDEQKCAHCGLYHVMGVETDCPLQKMINGVYNRLGAKEFYKQLQDFNKKVVE